MSTCICPNCGAAVPREHDRRNESIAAAVKSGRNLLEVAENFGLTRERVRQICAKRGIKSEAKGNVSPVKKQGMLMLSENVDEAVIASSLGVLPIRVAQWRREMGRRAPSRPRPVLDKIKSLAKEGKSPSDIAHAVGWKTASIRAVCHRYGIALVRSKVQPLSEV